MLTRFCNKQGCNEMISIDSMYCDRHKAESNARHKEYDLYRRDSAATAFYNSGPWAHMQAYILNKYAGIDVYAYYVSNEIIKATTVHHVVEIKDCWERRLDKKNLFPTSGSNHAVIHAEYKKKREEMQKHLFALLLKFRKEFRISLDP